MIHGFPARPTVTAGEDLVLHVATDAPAFRVRFLRWGRELVEAGRSDWLAGRAAPHHRPFQDWSRDNEGPGGEELPGWPAHSLPVGADWRPGVYVAVLEEGEIHARPDPDARSARALFVVRPRRPGAASVLYKLPLFTYHAYNTVAEAGWCLYDVPADRDVPPAVSVRRPGGGTGGQPWDVFNPDPYDPSLRQTFAHWDAPAVGWLEGEGVDVEYCTDLDLHEDPGLLDPYRLLLSFGHDEYWSTAMRDRLEGWVAGGGSAAFFSGNTAWWRIAFDEPHAYRRALHWHETGRPENEMTGVSFRHAGERRADVVDPPPVGFTVHQADHWLLEGTGLGAGDAFGHRPGEDLVGYECDGADFDRGAVARGRPPEPTGSDGTPPDFAIVGIGDLADTGWGMGNRAATLGAHEPGGTVVTGSTTDWPRLLAAGHPAIGRITRNVIARLG